MTNDTPSHSKRPLKQRPVDHKGARLLLEYTGMAAKYLVVLGISVWAGFKADQLISFDFPLFVWLLPFLCVVGLVIKAVLDTSK